MKPVICLLTSVTHPDYQKAFDKAPHKNSLKELQLRLLDEQNLKWIPVTGTCLCGVVVVTPIENLVARVRIPAWTAGGQPTQLFILLNRTAR